MTSTGSGRTDRLLAFLERDPDNVALLADAASAAFDEGRSGIAGELLSRLAGQQPLAPSMLNLSGLVAMHEGRFADAETAFGAATAAEPGDAAFRYNQAWARAAQKDWEGASELISEELAREIPAAATLKLQMLHHLGRLDDALAWGSGLVAAGSADATLLAALSAVAIDAEDVELAQDYAKRAGDAPEAVTTLGMVLLDQDDAAGAAEAFDRALSGNPQSARALLGKGLVRLADSDAAGAAALFDRAGTLFGDHLGTWVAAGWAYLIAGDLRESRGRFERALGLDDTFAEAHGGLAVIDVLERRLDDARRRTRTAMRLDRECFAGVLAQSLLLDHAGDSAAAQQLIARAAGTPIGASGQTIAQAAAVLAKRRR